MKEFQVKNLKDIAPKVNSRDGNEFRVKAVSDAGLMEKCSVNFVEVPPNNYAFSYHYHEVYEEVFYIISGEGSVRTIKGDIPVKAGDAISFPTGEGGAHVIKNTSTIETLVYIDFGTRGECEIVHFLDSKKIAVFSKSMQSMFDEPKV